MKKFKIITLGCKVNTYESEAIKEMLFNDGYEECLTDEADLVIVNTCAVTAVAGQKSRQMLNKAKKNNKNAIIVAIGCYAQLNGKNFDNADIIIGTSDKNKLIEKINTFKKEKERIICIDNARKRNEYECISITSYSEKTRAFVKIQDGCDNFCSYCIIPYTRGKSLSRDKKDILKEIHSLVLNGYKEIVLTGIDLASYGKNNNDSFVNLLKDILTSETKLLRLRISSIEASQIDDKFLDLLKNESRIAPHLHIPLQSGSETVLKRMNRKYNKEEFLQKINLIKSINPNIALACDVIVGFPLETDDEFKECVDFIDECGFDFLHVFPYSMRPGTPASKMEQIPSNVKKQRTETLIKHGKELSSTYCKRFDGKELKVLFETCDSDCITWKGYSENYIEVRVKTTENIHNRMFKVLYNAYGESKLLEEIK